MAEHGDRSTTTAEHVQRWRRRRSFSFFSLGFLHLVVVASSLIALGSGSLLLSERRLAYREVLQTEFRFRFRKGPRQISAGPGWSTPEKVEPNFLFCKPNFLFRFGSINSKKCVVLATRCIVMSKNTTEKLNLCLLLDHYSWN